MVTPAPEVVPEANLTNRRARIVAAFQIPVISFLWLFSSVFIHSLFGSTTSPSTILNGLNVTYVAFLTRLILLVNFFRPSWRTTFQDHIVLIRSVCICAPITFITGWAYYEGLSHTSVASCSTLTSAATIFAMLFRFHTPTAIDILASILIFLGVALIFIRDASLFSYSQYGTFKGDLLSLLTAVLSGAMSVTVDATFVKWCGHRKNYTDKYIAFSGIFISVIALPIVLLNGLQLHLVTGIIVAKLVLNALLGEVLTAMIWMRSTINTTPLVTSMTTSLMVPMSLVWDFFTEKQSLSTFQVIGSTLVVTGFLALSFEAWNMNIDVGSDLDRTRLDESEEQLSES